MWWPFREIWSFFLFFGTTPFSVELLLKRWLNSLVVITCCAIITTAAAALSGWHFVLVFFRCHQSSLLLLLLFAFGVLATTRGCQLTQKLSLLLDQLAIVFMDLFLHLSHFMGKLAEQGLHWFLLALHNGYLIVLRDGMMVNLVMMTLMVLSLVKAEAMLLLLLWNDAAVAWLLLLLEGRFLMVLLH